MKPITLFTQGYIGERLIHALKAANVAHIAYTYAAAATKRATDKAYLRDGYPYRYINERSFDASRIELTADSTVVCVDWTKDFFHHSQPACPVYHIHPSMLPMYRGYGAISEQFAKGIAISAVTLYKDSYSHVDAGDILYQEPIRVSLNDYPTDFIETMVATAACWLADIANGKPLPEGKPQDEALAFHTVRKRSKQGLIDFNLSAMSVYNHIRAYSHPYFGAYYIQDGKVIRVWRAICEKWTGDYGKAGEVLEDNRHGMEIACGEGSVMITEYVMEDTI
jgi:methionyl-tRNA formyltransferase